MKKTDAAVFILFGQSNAAGHWIPMEKCDIIDKPLKNVFGLSRELNQTFDNKKLFWSGYKSSGMNLAEPVDDTYSVANCLAMRWQGEIDLGGELPDLYIVHIAVGGQGVTEGYMWNPDYEKKLETGKGGDIDVDISLYPYALHILSMVDDSFKEMEKTYDIIGLHWRGGENDFTVPEDELANNLQKTYKHMFDGFRKALNINAEIVLHRLYDFEKADQVDPSGEHRKSTEYINYVFESLAKEDENISVFDVGLCPWYKEGVRGNGIFIEDVVHYNPETNAWVAKKIYDEYVK